MELLLTGDINCKLDGMLAEDPLRELASVFREADVRLGNLEGAFHDPAVGLAYKPGWYNCEPEGFALIDGRFDAVACANNVHFGAAIDSSAQVLDRAGVLHTGAGRDLAEARRPAIVERAGKRIGLLSYTAIFWPIGHAADPDSPGVATVRSITSYQPHPRLVEMPGAPAVVRTWPHPDDVASVQQDIEQLAKEVDVVVVYFHWGVTGQDEIAEYQRTLAHHAIDAGADIVAGSHPHIPQGVEFYREGAILYSLGNFMFGWKLHPEMTSDGLVARITVQEEGAWSLALNPVTRTADGEIAMHAPDSTEGRRIGSRVAELSARYGTEFVAEADRFRVHGSSGHSFGRGREAVISV